MRKLIRIGTAGAAFGLAVSVVACAPTTTDDGTATAAQGENSYAVTGEATTFKSAQELVDSFDTSKLCGDEELVIAHPRGLGVGWLLTQDAILENHLEQFCPNVKLVATDAQADPAKANSDLNSLVAQGVDGVVIDPLFGEAMLPAMQAVKDAGIPIATYVSSAGATEGKEVTAVGEVYTPGNGVIWADFMNRALEGEGTIVFLGGGPGQPSSISNMEAIKDNLKQYPGLTLVEEEFQPISNDAAEARTVMSALLAKHGRINGVIADNGGVVNTVIEAYDASGFEPPAFAVSAATNGLNCAWEDRKDFPYFSTDGNHMGSISSLRRVLAEINGVEFDQSLTIAPWAVVDTLTSGMEPKCDSSVSPDIDWTTSLSDERVKQIFG
ncbi:MAG: substrate-binding domain-containing protein [Actinomycetota bacterium]